MKDNEERYCDKVVDMIMKYDVRFGIIKPFSKDYDKYVIDKFHYTSMFGVYYRDPSAFFKQWRWYKLENKIKNKYGVLEDNTMVLIKEKLMVRFSEHPYVIKYRKGNKLNTDLHIEPGSWIPLEK